LCQVSGAGSIKSAVPKRIKVFAPQENDASARAAVKQFTQALHTWVSENRSPTAVSAEHRFSALAVSSDWLKKEKKDADAAYGTTVQRSAKSAEKEPARGGLNDDAMSALAAIKANRKGPAQA
jgi:hypothetical protein